MRGRDRVERKGESGLKRFRGEERKESRRNRIFYSHSTYMNYFTLDCYRITNW